MGPTKPRQRGKNCQPFLLALPEAISEAKGSQYKATKAAYKPKGYDNYQDIKPAPLSLQIQQMLATSLVFKTMGID